MYCGWAMSVLPLGRYRELLSQLLQLNEQTAALRRELGAWVESGTITDSAGGSASQPASNGSSPQRASASSTPRRGKLDNEVLTDPWSSMESSNSVLTESGGPSASSDPDSGQPAGSPGQGVTRQQPVMLSTQAVIEAGATPKRRYVHTRPEPDGQRPQHKHSSQLNGSHKVTTNFSLDLEQIELMDDDVDEPSTSTTRKPHFLDDDYHLQKNDVCRIPKPHFLDHSPSPEEERLSNITNPHFLDEVQDERISNGGSSRRSNVRPCNEASRFRDFKQRENTNYSRYQVEERHSSERQHGNNLQRSEVLPGQASTSSDRHFYESGWPGDRELWQSQDSCSVKSFSSAGSGNAPSGALPHQQLGPKVDCVYSLLSLLSLSADSNADMSEYLLEMSHTVESCVAMRQSGCIPLLVQLIHSKLSRASRNKAARALHNMIHAQPDDKAGRREARVLRLLEQVREYCQCLEDLIASLKEESEPIEDDMSKHPVQSVAALMKLSFDEEHRHVMCQLGGLQSLAALVTIDQCAHGSMIENEHCVTMRKYSGMALTNLTFGDGNNKALLCSFKDFMTALVDQLQSPNDDMRQVTAAVLRNLSWRADTASKKILREVGTVKGLTVAAMTGHKEATLKSVLSALWNLTAHCSLNKVDICSVDGALAFLVDMLSFNAPSKTLAIIENAGGILRNVSSHIAVREDYRQVLRERNCLKVLLQQLKSPSLTIVSNSCGTLWNLSARCHQDQQYLWDHGAVPMLRSLIHSKHKMIAMGSSAALKNLLNSKPGKNHIVALDSTARDLNLPILPTLGARKQKALEQVLDQNLSETCENIEPVTSPTTSNRDEKMLFTAAERHLAMSMEKRRMSSSSPLMGHLASQISLSHSSHFGGYLSCSNTLLLQSSLQKGHMSRTMLHGRYENVNRSESRDSVTSTHSDSVYERVTRNSKIPNHSNTLDQRVPDKSRGSCSSVNTAAARTDRDFIKRYSKEGGLVKYDNLGDISSRHSSDMTRNNYSELTYDENESCDQPIDYSKKYSETKSSDLHSESIISEYSVPSNGDPLTHSETGRSSVFQMKKESISPSGSNAPVNYTNYQETDLDQPTDYSLRYAEDQSDVASELSEGRPPSIHEDTIKHFCTEGTPYETPINFSTATSMSDLRTIGTGLPITDKLIKVEESKIDNVSLVMKQSVEVMSQSDEKDSCSLEEISKHDNDRALCNSRNSANQVVPQSTSRLAYESKFSSGMISPEKPVNYCEEGTPGYFSRVSSLSSLEEGGNDAVKITNWNSDGTNDVEVTGHYTPPTTDDVGDGGDQSKEKDAGKVVTFGTSPGVLNYAEETPLMFSRCSSLESLSGCSVPDQADDIASVVSEFSRMTSGCLSPSEIPDSPTHSPLPRGDSSAVTVPTASRFAKQLNKSPPQPINRLRSVFEDEVNTFMCEHTPVEFSTATSLSSLTIDDEPTSKVIFTKPFDTKNRTDGVGSSNPEDHMLPSLRQSFPSGSISEDNSVSGLGDCSSERDLGEQGEDLLAACISQGMQARIKTRTPNVSIRSGPIITSSPINSHHQKSMHISSVPDTAQPSTDAFLTYCTEDTPAFLSKAGSRSDLSTLSLLEENEEEKGNRSVDVDHLADRVRDYSDDSSNFSGDSGNLLAECILSGMPKKIEGDYQEPRCIPIGIKAQPRVDPPRIIQSALPAYLVAQDEIETYAIEGSPFQHSLSSSLSDLTVDSSTGCKARLISGVRAPSAMQNIPGRDSGSRADSSPHASPAGSLSSVDLGSDDGRLLDMAIQAGVPKHKDDPSYISECSYKRSKSPSLLEQKKSQDSCTLDEKSEEHVTVLTRHDSLSSLSVDSLGSNEGEQALFEQCIKSGMPKARINRKWDDIHSKTLDRNFKARSADKNNSDLPKSHVRSHKSLERNKDDRKGKLAERDPEFESLVAAGAFKNCTQKLSKTEEDIMDRALLEEAIYCGMPKRRDKADISYRGPAVLPDSTMQYQANVYYHTTFSENQPNVSYLLKKDSSNSDSSKNVQVTSVVADNSPSCSPLMNTGALQAASDVKTAVEVGNTARNTATDGPPTLRMSPMNIIKHQQITLPPMESEQRGKKPSFNGGASEVSRFNSTMNDGSEKCLDDIDGNKLPKAAVNKSNSFNYSISDRSNKHQALDSSNCLNDTHEPDINQSNESCAVILDQSQNDLDDHFVDDVLQPDDINVDSTLMLVSSKTLVQSSNALCSSLKYINHAGVEITLVESITGKNEKDSEKHSSTDTWNENTCPNDVSFSTFSGSLPMMASFKSDLGDEVTSTGVLPDLLEESVVISDGPNRPDLTNQLCNNMTADSFDDQNSANDNQNNLSYKSAVRTEDNYFETNQIRIDLQNISIDDVSNNSKCLKDTQYVSVMNDSAIKCPTMTNSTMIEQETDMMSRVIRESSYDYSSCLTESGHSLDLDNVKPPSHMGSLLSLTHSLSGNWDDNLDRERLHCSLTKRNINKIQRKKSLPVGLMIKRALGYSHSNQGSSENLDCAVSNLENVKPPSEMDDVFDMENSMISVASIVSEVADTQDDDASTIIFDFKQPVNGARLMSHLSVNLDIENINPPSLFDELTESTLENDDDDDENCLTHTLAYCPDIPSGSESATPIASDFGSSAESTPKKNKSGNKKYLTPKQKRQLARDRYKTYTIAAEMAIKEEESRKKVPEAPASLDTILAPNYNCENLSIPSMEIKDKKNRSNPKQRRQEDRARYQTQTVNISSLTLTSTEITSTPINIVKDPEIEELKRRLEAKKSMKQKRVDNADRYKTRTLDESVASLECSVPDKSEIMTKSSIPKPSCFSPQLNVPGYSQIQSAADAAQTLEYLQQSTEESLIADLDCETISLVSIEDDSELNSLRMKTFTKSFRNYLPVIESPTAVDKCIEKNLKNMNHSAIVINSFDYLHKIKDINEMNGCNGDLNSLECDQNSGTESADQNHYSDSEVEVPHVKGKPKIVKPERDQSVDSNESVEIEDNIPKTIRGRRKALYVSPYKRNGSAPKKSPARTTLTVKSAKGAITSKMTNGAVTKIQGGVKTPLNLTKISHVSAKSTVGSFNRNSTHVKNKTIIPSKNKSPVNGTEVVTPKPPLVRQGTFTKEDGSAVSSSNATIPKTPEKKLNPNSKLTKPGTIVKAVVNTSPSRLPQPPPKVSSKPVLKKTVSNESTVVKASNFRTSSNLTTKTSSSMKSSSSNQSLQSNDSGKTITLSSKAIKCSSSSSVNSASFAPNPKPHTKDVTSKIANLWKKVEQSKKSSTKPDARVWISSNESPCSTSQDAEEPPAEPATDIPNKSKLIRSSTFEGSPKAESSVRTPPKQKSSIAIRVSQSPSLRYSSKVPIVRTVNGGIVNPALKRGKP